MDAGSLLSAVRKSMGAAARSRHGSPTAPTSGGGTSTRPGPRGEWRAVAPLGGLAGVPPLTVQASAFRDTTAAAHPVRPVMRSIAAEHRLAPSITGINEPGRPASSSAHTATPDSQPLPFLRSADDIEPPADADAQASSPIRQMVTEPVPRHVSPASVRAATQLHNARPSTASADRPVAPQRPSTRPTSMVTVTAPQRRTIVESQPARGQLDLVARDPRDAVATPSTSHPTIPAEAMASVPELGANATTTPSEPAVPGEHSQQGADGQVNTAVSRPAGRRREQVRTVGLGEPLPVSGRAAVPGPTHAPSSAAGSSQTDERAVAHPGTEPVVPASEGESFLAKSASPHATPSRAPQSSTVATMRSAGSTPASRQRHPRQRRPLAGHEASPAASQEAAASQVSETHGAAAASELVHVDRSEAGETAAAQLGANAFTSGSTIVLPPSHGPLESPRARSLLAHELVHVDQQRRLGSSLPPEDSPEGQALEHEAGEAERRSVSAPSTPVPAVAGTARMSLPVARTRSRENTPSSTPASADTSARQHSDIEPRQLDHNPGRSHDGSSGLAAMIADLQPNASLTAGAGSADMLTFDAPPPQRAAASSAAPDGGAPDADADDAEFEELARRLYDRIGYRVRRELLLDRERSGLLADMR